MSIFDDIAEQRCNRNAEGLEKALSDALEKHFGKDWNTDQTRRLIKIEIWPDGTARFYARGKEIGRY